MNWEDTFGVFGMDAEDVAEKLGLHSVECGYVPSSAADCRVIAYNQNQEKLYRELENQGLVGVVIESQGRDGASVLQRNNERTYTVRFGNPVRVEVQTPNGLVKENLDTLFVKRWESYFSTGSREDAKREFDELMEVDAQGHQSPVTIPIALLEYGNEIQLVKAREPIVTFNDLHMLYNGNGGILGKILGKSHTNGNVKELYKKMLKEGFRNWAILAGKNHYQLSMLALDHFSGEGWHHDFGFEGEISPGQISGGVEEPSNLGIVRFNGLEYCIVRDLEHVRTRDEIETEPLPHEGDRDVGLIVGDRYTSKLGRTITSLTMMAARTGVLLGLSEKEIRKTMGEAFTEAYNTLFNRQRVSNFEIPKGVIDEVKRYISWGSVTPSDLTVMNDLFIAPEYMRVGLDIIDGTYFEDQDRRAALPNKQELLSRFSEGCERDWHTCDKVMDNLVDLCGYENPSDSDVPYELMPDILDKISVVASKDPQRALKLSEKLSEEEPQDKKAVKEVFKN